MVQVVDWRRPPIPQEHGGWAMLITPPVVALAAAGPSWLGMMAMLGWFMAYCLRGPVELLMGNGPSGRAGMARATPEVARVWLVIFGLLTVALLGPVVYLRPAAWVPLLAALVFVGIVLLLALRGLTRSVTAGSLAAVGLMAGGPLYMIGATGEVGRNGWLLTIACAAFFVGSVFRVKVLGRERRSGSFRHYSVALHVLFLLGAVAAIWLVGASWFYPVAVLAPLVWAVRGALHDPVGKPLSLRAIGESEKHLTFLFGFLLMGAFWI